MTIHHRFSNDFIERGDESSRPRHLRFTPELAYISLFGLSLFLNSSRWRPRHFAISGPLSQTERHRTTFSVKQQNCRPYSGFRIKSNLRGRFPGTRMEGGQGAASGGAVSPTTSVRPGTGGSYKRKRSGAEFESSPGSGGEDNEDEGERRRQPGVKRACNECRQQKVSHGSSR